MIALCCTIVAAAPSAHRPRRPSRRRPLVERVGDTGFIQLQSPSFAQLDAEAEGARLLADAGVDRDRSDHLRPAVGLRPAPEAPARRRSSRTGGSRARRPSSRRSASTRCSSGPTAATTTRSPRRNSCRRSRSRSCRPRRSTAQAGGRVQDAVRPTCRRSRSRRRGQAASSRRCRRSIFDRDLRADDHREDAAGRARTSCRRARTRSTSGVVARPI